MTIQKEDNKQKTENIMKFCKSLAQLNVSLINALESKDKFIDHLIDKIREKDQKIEELKNEKS